VEQVGKHNVAGEAIGLLDFPEDADIIPTASLSQVSFPASFSRSLVIYTEMLPREMSRRFPSLFLLQVRKVPRLPQLQVHEPVVDPSNLDPVGP